MGPAPVTMSSGAALATRHAEKLRDLDAIVCVSDPVAFGVVMSLEGLGLRVPQDIAVTGFGDFEISRICRPSITTLDVGAEQIGAVTGKLARQVLLGGEVEDAVFETVTPKLLCRDTTE